MAENTAQEKTEEATPKRREDTKKKGQVARSKELNTLVSLVASGVGMMIFGKQIIQDINQMLRDGLSFGRDEAFNTSMLPMNFMDAIMACVSMLAPLMALLAISAIASPMSMGGWVFSGDQIRPKLERISIFKGIGRMFSPKSLMELVKAIGKFFLVGGVACFVLYIVLDDILKLPLQPLSEAFRATGSLFIWCLLAFSSTLILIACIDVPFQIFEFKKQIKMTKQEVKEEMKDTDGRPEVKGAIRERQQEMANKRMMGEVPTADVVITNPTHYAVALRYDQESSGAPRVVAKGTDFIAAKIREIADENEIAIFRAPPLARALYASTELDQEIPGNLFLAVAQVLAYIFQLQQARRGKAKMPVPPRSIKVPEEYTRREQEKAEQDTRRKAQQNAQEGNH